MANVNRVAVAEPIVCGSPERIARSFIAHNVLCLEEIGAGAITLRDSTLSDCAAGVNPDCRPLPETPLAAAADGHVGQVDDRNRCGAACRLEAISGIP